MDQNTQTFMTRHANGVSLQVPYTIMTVDDSSIRFELHKTASAKCTLVTYPTVEPSSQDGLGSRCYCCYCCYIHISNPALWEELGFFLIVLTVGFVLTYTRNDGALKLFDYGTFFFNAGVIPAITVVLAPLVRSVWNNNGNSNNTNYGSGRAKKDESNKDNVIDDDDNNNVAIRELVMYILFVALGATMMALDRDAFAPSNDDDAEVEVEDDVEDGTSWRIIIGGSMFEAGLVYFAIRSFLLNEAPEDRARRLDKEVSFLRESVSKGMCLAYFLNFLKWVCKDMVTSRTTNHHHANTNSSNGVGPIEFQPEAPAPVDNKNKLSPSSSAVGPPKTVVEHISNMIVIVPMLELVDFEDTSRDRTNIISAFQSQLEAVAVGGNRAVRGSIHKPNNNQGSFSRGQNILKLTVVKDQGSGGGSGGGGIDRATVFIDIPSTLLALWTNTTERDSPCKTPMKRYEAYKRDARRFSSQLVWNLKKNSMADLAVVFEYEGSVDNFYSVLALALLKHCRNDPKHLVQGGNNLQAQPQQQP
jgi:hypothetical protein